MISFSAVLPHTRLGEVNVGCGVSVCVGVGGWMRVLATYIQQIVKEP